MANGITAIRKLLFGGGVAAALCFGATQAVAAPGLDGSAARQCIQERCHAYCQTAGFFRGDCVNGICVCS